MKCQFKATDMFDTLIEAGVKESPGGNFKRRLVCHFHYTSNTL